MDDWKTQLAHRTAGGRAARAAYKATAGKRMVVNVIHSQGDDMAAYLRFVEGFRNSWWELEGWVVEIPMVLEEWDAGWHTSLVTSVDLTPSEIEASTHLSEDAELEELNIFVGPGLEVDWPLHEGPEKLVRWDEPDAPPYHRGMLSKL